MPTRISLLLSFSILLASFPGSAQRSSGFASHRSFGSGRAMGHFGRGGCSSGGASRAFARPYGFRGPRLSSPSRFFSGPGFRSRTAIPRNSFVPRPPDGRWDVRSPQRSEQPTESRAAVAREDDSQPSTEHERRFQPTTERSSLSVSRQPSQAGRTSLGFRRMSRFVPRPPLPSSRAAGSIHVSNVGTFAIADPPNSLPSQFVLHLSSFANPLLFRRSLFFSSVSFNPFFARPLFVSPFFFNPFSPFFFGSFFVDPFLFPQPFLFSPFFSPTFFFPQPFFFSVFVSNSFFLPQPPLFSPFFSSRFIVQDPFLVSSFSRRPLVFR